MLDLDAIRRDAELCFKARKTTAECAATLGALDRCPRHALGLLAEVGRLRAEVDALERAGARAYLTMLDAGWDRDALERLSGRPGSPLIRYEHRDLFRRAAGLTTGESHE
jgi:hypothetical protein